MKELAGDAFVELSGWDGKFIETFRLLLRQPGELTRQFIEGKRVRYIAPVGLYLTLSLPAQKAPRLFRPIFQRVLTDPAGFRHNVLENMPRVLFVLVPLLGLFVGRFYRARHYPEHLYFAIHVASYVFLVMSVVELSKFTRIFGLYAALNTISQFSIAVYACLALRRGYGGSIARTLANELGITLLFATFFGCAVLGVAYYAAVAA